MFLRRGSGFSRIVMSAEVFLNLGGTTDMLFALSFGSGRFFVCFVKY